MADNDQYESVEDIANIVANHSFRTILQTPLYGNTPLTRHADFDTAARAARSRREEHSNPDVIDMDFDLATASSSAFRRLSSAIERAANSRRFQP